MLPPSERLRRFGGALLLAALCAACAEGLEPVTAAQPLPPVGSCSLTVGEADLKVPTSSWQPLDRGEPLYAGDQVRTGALGFARLDLRGRGTLRLEGDTQVRLAPPDRAGVTAELDHGSLRGELDAPVGGEKQRVIVALSNADVSVTLTAKSGGSAVVRLTRREGVLEAAVLDGEVFLKAKEAQATLHAADVMDVSAQGLQPTQRLLPGPSPLAPAPDARFFCPALVVRLQWEPLADAKGYRVEVAQDGNFQSKVHALQTERPHTLWLAGAPGRYHWRVQARDAAGRWGVPSAPSLLHCEPTPPTDLLVSPAPRAKVKAADGTATVELTWNAFEGARGYRWRVAKGESLQGADALEGVVEATHAKVELGSGEHTWGVYTEDGQPLFVAPRLLTVDRGPARPVKVPSALRNWGQ